jgi:hypothetical protein
VVQQPFDEISHHPFEPYTSVESLVAQ